MAKKILMVSLTLLGLTLGVIGVSAQEATPTQSAGLVSPVTSATPAIPATPATPVSLLSPISVDSSAIPESNLYPGTRNPQVKKLQEALKSLGYLPSNFEATENFGQSTKDAIKKFQQNQGLSVVGSFGPVTRAALKNKLKTNEVVVDKNVDIACMKTAVEKRENALLAAYDVLGQKIKTTRETRKTDLLAAWSVQDPKERHMAIKAAWDKYRESVKNARTEWNQSRKTVWTQFSQDAKNCKASAVETQSLENVEVIEE